MAAAPRLGIAGAALGLSLAACSSLPSKADYGTVAVDYQLVSPASIRHTELIWSGKEISVHGYVAYPRRDEGNVARWRLQMTVTTPDGHVISQRRLRLIALRRTKSFGRLAFFDASAGEDLSAGSVVHLALAPAP